MNDIIEKPKLDVGAIRDQVNKLIHLRDLRQAAIARETGLTASALSRFLVGRYEGDNEAVASKLFAWTESLSKRDSMPSPLTRSHGFVNTSVTRKIVAGLDYAQIAPDLVVIIGEPGVGKTATLDKYRQTGSSVWMSTMSPDTAGQVPMLEELGAVLGIDTTGGAAKIRRRIVARIRDTGGLIIIDEAQHLDLKAIEALRGIHDATSIGMVLCGNPLLMTRIGKSHQVNSRVGRKITLRKPLRADVLAIGGQFDVRGRDEQDFLHTISQYPGGLRCVVKTIRLAMLTAAGDETAVDMAHLCAAWSELALEDQI